MNTEDMANKYLTTSEKLISANSQLRTLEAEIEHHKTTIDDLSR
jgi:hypothetical protein